MILQAGPNLKPRQAWQVLRCLHERGKRELLVELGEPPIIIRRAAKSAARQSMNFHYDLIK